MDVDLVLTFTGNRRQLDREVKKLLGIVRSETEFEVKEVSLIEKWGTSRLREK
jgi:hypothetical protein